MQNAAWQALLRHIPPEQQGEYMVVTTSGAEIAVQHFLRVENELVVFKGRLAGSQDQGLLFFLPYDRIDYIGTTKSVKDSDVAETFGSLTFPVPGAAAESAGAAGAEASGGSAEAAAPPPPKPIIRSEVLERFRSRSASSLNLPPAKPPQG